MFLLGNFVLTVISEFGVIALIRKRKTVQLFFVVIGAHLITHPFGAWLLQKEYNYWGVEFSIVIIEALLYWKIIGIDCKKAVLYSIIANTVSILCGLALKMLI